MSFRSDRLIGRVADGGQGALTAKGIARDADLSAEQDQLMTEGNPPVLRHQFHQILLDFFRCLFVGQFQSVGDAENMRVHYDAAGDAEGRSQDHIGGFARDPGEGEQLFHRARNLPAVILHDLGGRGDNVFRLVAEEARGMDLPLQILLRQAYVIPRGGVFAEEFRGDFVHPLVGTLGRENGGHEKLESVLMVQRAFGVGEEPIKRREDLLQASG